MKVRHKIWQRLVTRDAKNEDSRVEMFDLLKAARCDLHDTSSSERSVVSRVRQRSRPCRPVTLSSRPSTPRASSR